MMAYTVLVQMPAPGYHVCIIAKLMDWFFVICQNVFFIMCVPFTAKKSHIVHVSITRWDSAGGWQGSQDIALAVSLLHKA